MENHFKYKFWVWKEKLIPTLIMFGKIEKYDLTEENILAIISGLRSSESGFTFKINSINVKLAYDKNEIERIIHVLVAAPNHLKDKIETINLFQASFSEIK